MRLPCNRKHEQILFPIRRNTLHRSPISPIFYAEIRQNLPKLFLLFRTYKKTIKLTFIVLARYMVLTFCLLFQAPTPSTCSATDFLFKSDIISVIAASFSFSFGQFGSGITNGSKKSAIASTRPHRGTPSFTNVCQYVPFTRIAT